MEKTEVPSEKQFLLWVQRVCRDLAKNAASAYDVDFEALNEVSLGVESRLGALDERINHFVWLRVPHEGGGSIKVAAYNDTEGTIADVAEAYRKKWTGSLDEQEFGAAVIVGYHYAADPANAYKLTFVCSLRAIDPAIDVSAIAAANGGGGHRAAAGFTIACSTASQGGYDIDPAGPLFLLRSAFELAAGEPGLATFVREELKKGNGVYYDGTSRTNIIPTMRDGRKP